MGQNIQTPLGITTDNPGVFRANPYPYPSKPVSVYTDTDIRQLGYGLSVNPGVITLIRVHGYPISVNPRVSYLFTDSPTSAMLTYVCTRCRDGKLTKQMKLSILHILYTIYLHSIPVRWYHVRHPLLAFSSEEGGVVVVVSKPTLGSCLRARRVGWW